MEDVVIIGAGPSGLFAAAELARHGVRARLLEHDIRPHRQVRATTIQPASLETLERAGVAAAFLGAAVRVNRTRFFGPGLCEIGISGFELAGCRYPFQCSLPQWQSEALLTAHLERLGGRVEHGATVVAVTRDPGAVRLEVAWAEGRTETVAARFLLDAGGAHSITRSALKEQLEGETYAGRHVVADVRLAESGGAADESRVIVDAAGFVFMAPLPGSRWILFVGEAGEGPVSGPPSGDAVAALARRHLGRDMGVHDVGWTAAFVMHRRIAPRLADAGCFLLGDAAHLSSPLGGEGLNSGLMDAADIAWKLALVLSGRARPSLLESYAVERSMADRHVLEVSDLIHRRVIGLVEACADGPPAPQPPDLARDRTMQRSRAMVDVSYEGSPLVGEHRGTAPPAEAPRPGLLYPERIALGGTRHHLLLFGQPPATLSGFAARWAGLVEPVDAAAAGLDAVRAGLPEGGALLVRPDGFIGFRAAPADAAGLAALDRHLATYLVPTG